jgi:Flp pilus assembly protein TadG
MSQPGRLAPPAHTEPPPAGTRTCRSRGQAMVEFTLILPLLLLLILGIYQFGQTYADYIQVTNAARDGGRKALVSRSDASGVADAVTAAKNATWWLDKSQMVVTVSPGQPWTQGQTVTVTVTYPYTINLLGLVVASGNLKSTTTVRME